MTGSRYFDVCEHAAGAELAREGEYRALDPSSVASKHHARWEGRSWPSAEGGFAQGDWFRGSFYCIEAVSLPGLGL
jgi:hypothetical protein